MCYIAGFIRKTIKENMYFRELKKLIIYTRGRDRSVRFTNLSTIA